MLTRREFHKSLTGLAIASLASGPLRATAATGDDLSDQVFLNRLTHGTTPDARAELAQIGQSAWLEKQLQMPARDADLSARFAATKLWIEYEAGDEGDGKTWPALAEGRGLEWLDRLPEDMVKLLDWDVAMDYSERERPAHEVIAASFIRAVHAPAQLREIITQFWHEHFSVNALKDETTAALYPAYDSMLRENAFGNFRTLLGHTAHAPVMLHYLNNDESSASPANENYARELLELHTLGQDSYFNDLYDRWDQVPGALEGEAVGYIDSDVYEVARALTGWSIGDGREFDNGEYTKTSGEFDYVEAWHDPYQKRILGREFPAFSGPTEDGEGVLDILAAHPGTARFVTKKLLRRLGIENPSKEYHDQIFAVFFDNQTAPDQIAMTLRAIVQHEEFAATPANKLRRPFEYVAALYRATGAEISPTGSEMDWRLGTSGWNQHQVRPPTGHSDKTEDWADTRTINGMIGLASYSHDDWNGVTENILATLADGVNTIGDMVGHWAERFDISTDSFDAALSVLDVDASDPAPTDKDGIDWTNQILVASAALGPDFVFR